MQFYPPFGGMSGSVPWANRPPAAQCAGQLFEFIGSDGYKFRCISDGVMWVPVGAFRRLPRNPLPAVTTMSTTTITIPGGLMGPNGELRVWMRFSHAKTSSQKLLQINAGAALICNFPSSSATAAGGDYVARLLNRGSQSSQSITYNSYSGIGIINDVATASVDTSVDFPLIIGGQMAVATDGLAIEPCSIDVIPGW